MNEKDSRGTPWAGCYLHQWRYISCPLCRNLVGTYKMYRSDKEMMDFLTQRDNNEYHAHKMLEIFFRGYDINVGLVSNDILLKLKGQFGGVEEKDRADVFVMFTNMLNKRNIKFNVKQFQI